MNFFERQAASRRSSLRLLVLFARAVAGIVAAVDFAVAVFGHSDSGQLKAATERHPAA